MASEDVLRKTLKNVDGKPFQKYKGIQNNFVLEDYEIIFDDVQNDWAGHTSMRVRVPLKKAGFPDDTHDTKDREIALRDLIARRFRESARTHARSPIPKTSGGEVFIPRPGQEMIERWSIVFSPYFVEARFTVDLPADGNKVSAMAMDLLLERIRTIVSESMYYSSYKPSKVYNHIQTYENAEFIRRNLSEKGLIAFIAEGSVLPRRDDDLAPMVDAVPFRCDDALKVKFDVPYGEPIVGMGIPKGFTVIAGAGRSGKSTLLDAVFAGVYNHISGDGREYVISSRDAAYIMAEPDRPADSVDISMFAIELLELNETSNAKTEFVSSPVSELLSISEAVEMGSDLLLFDEEYSNPGIIRRGFLSEDERITPVSELAHSMGEQGISVIVVSGDESVIRRADNVIVVKDFGATKRDVERSGSHSEYRRPSERMPVSKSMVFEKGRKEVSVTPQSIRTIEIGEFKVNVPVSALFDMCQTSTVADVITVMKDLMDGSRSMSAACNEAIELIKAADNADNSTTGMHHGTVRAMDVAAVLNRHPQMLAIRKS
ncbi:ABC transporter ATP-binding protein [methanogenic archaeon mixed culture ISO4-G1]|nr:ABC transporter ATP-binding protein [methanogenic archaeon mixed culture ISO4-G1]